MNNPVDTIILDLDGTLIESTADIASAVDEVLTARSLPQAGVAHTRGWIGDGAAALVERALAWGLGRAPTASEATSALADFMTAYDGTCCRTTRLADGMPELLKALRTAKVSLTIASNKPQRFCTRILEHLGVRSGFCSIVGGDTTVRRKPDPLPLRKAVADAGGKWAWMIGDSELDRHAAAAAGFPFIGLLGGYRPTHPETLAPARESEVIGVSVGALIEALHTLRAQGTPLMFTHLRALLRAR